MEKRFNNANKISIHAPTGGSDGLSAQEMATKLMISIHAPTGGSDFVSSFARLANAGISIHAPTGGATRLYSS